MVICWIYPDRGQQKKSSNYGCIMNISWYIYTIQTGSPTNSPTWTPGHHLLATISPNGNVADLFSPESVGRSPRGSTGAPIQDKADMNCHHLYHYDGQISFLPNEIIMRNQKKNMQKSPKNWVCHLKIPWCHDSVWKHVGVYPGQYGKIEVPMDPQYRLAIFCSCHLLVLPTGNLT